MKIIRFIFFFGFLFYSLGISFADSERIDSLLGELNRQGFVIRIAGC